MANNSIESLMPRDVAMQAENAGVIKANLDFMSTLMLSLLAGAFIGFGAVFSTTVMTGNGLDGAIKLPFGLIRLIGAASFCLGLILVTIAGAEMFTGNVLLVMAAASRKISASKLSRNWSIVFLGNLAGATATAYLIFLTGQHMLMNGQVGRMALEIARVKCELSFSQALMRAFFCNTLVCLAIWLSLSGRTAIDKVAVILFPITAFVTAGFEHCVANMYFMSIALFIKDGVDPGYWQQIGASAEQFASITWKNYLLGNLVPVTVGNTLGGLVVGLMYWVIYCRSNIMLRSEDKELLRRLAYGGRRQGKRADVQGIAIFRFGGRQFHGKLRNLSEAGVMAEFYEATGLPVIQDSIHMDLKINNGQLELNDLPGLIVNSNTDKNLMGRDFLTYSVRLGKISDKARAELKKLVAHN